MEDNFIVDMSRFHLSKEDRIIVKTAEKALRELDFTSFRVWLSLVASNGYNPQQIMADYNFTMEQVTHSMGKAGKERLHYSRRRRYSNYPTFSRKERKSNSLTQCRRQAC